MNTQSFLDLLLYKTRANLRAEVSRYYLAYFWWVLSPLFNMAVLYMVFGVFMNRPQEYFGLFLLIGITQWQWFANTTLNAANSIWISGGVMRQVNIPKVFFPLEVFLQDAFKHLFVLLLLGIFLAFHPQLFSIAWVAAPLVFCILAVFILACAILAAAIVPFLPDFRFVLQTLIHGLFFLSGIFFSIDAYILPQHRPYLYLNPMAGIIRELRRIFITGEWPDWVYLLNVAASSFLLLGLALLVVRRCSPLYPRLCQE